VRSRVRKTKQERKIYIFLLLTVLELCKTQLLTNLTPQNGSKHFLKPGYTSVKITAALATSGVVYDAWF